MESWCYFSGVKEYVCDKSVSASSENGGKNSGPMGWGLSPSISLENNMECSTHGSIENQESVELSFPQMMRKFFPSDSEKVLHPVIVHPNNAFSEAEEEPSSLVVDSNSRDSSLVDLKLGSTSDQKETLSLNSSISNHNLSYTVAKRPRPGSCSSQMAFCQVYGCRKDLRSSKDYHKRHKVCEVHSKTAKVIVNGVEQRFCQQCSRFHVLVEFDNGKRSCRKRLAGHNERRRKPRVGVNSSRLGWFQDYNGSRFQDTTSTSSIVWQSRHISSLQHQQKYEVDDWNTPVKVEHGVDFSPQIDNRVTSEQLHSKSLPISYTSGKQHFPLHVGDNGALTRSKIDEINELSMQDHFTCSDISSPSLSHNSSVGSKYSMFLDSSSYFQELSGMQNSGHAFSLLSSLSQDSSISSSKAHSGHPLVTSDSDSSYDLSKVSQKLLAVSHGPSTTGISKVGHSSWINSTENCLQPLSKHHW